MSSTLVVAAASARPYVAMARAAGYDVVAMDIFADTDTRAMAKQVFCLPYVHGSFEPTGFESALSALSGVTDVCGFVYGSGFEAHPALLEMVAAQMPVIGNAAEVVVTAKAVPGFFSVLAYLGLPYPDTLTHYPPSTSGWLSKRAGGSGGTHVRRLMESGSQLYKTEYYQREVSGTPVSILFAADGRYASVVGYNRQYVSSFADLPFRYAGLVTQADLPVDCQHILRLAAQGLTEVLQLRGLNSVDAVLAEDGSTYILELNPRLTASAGLYQPSQHLLQLHLDSSAGRQVILDVAPIARAQAVMYAKQAFVVSANIDWPAWVADIPHAGAVLEAGEPVCTVYAESHSADEAWRLVEQRLLALLDIQYGKVTVRHLV